MRKKVLITALCAILVIVIAYFGVSFALFMDSPFGQVYTGDEIDKVEISEGEFAVNALIMGLDKDETRTDTLLFFRYNSNDGKCFIMSIPRDTYVYIDGRAALINSAYSMGGAELTINKVKELTGLPVNYYVIFTFKDFRNVIDALGGVEFDVRPQGYYYEDPYQDLVINIPGGRQILDGEKAEGLVRFRADYERADLKRVEVQREFVSALIEQKFNAEYIASVPKIYNTLKDSLKCNISISSLLSYAEEVLKTGITQLDSFTLPTIEYGAHLLPDEEGIKNILAPYISE